MANRFQWILMLSKENQTFNPYVSQVYWFWYLDFKFCNYQSKYRNGQNARLLKKCKKFFGFFHEIRLADLTTIVWQIFKNLSLYCSQITTRRNMNSNFLSNCLEKLGISRSGNSKISNLGIKFFNPSEF